MTHQPDRVAQVVAWLRAMPWPEQYGIPWPSADKLADAIEAGEPFKETPDA